MAHLNGNGVNVSNLQLSNNTMIRDVWAENLEKEFAIICELIKSYPYVAMDTEFPGVVAKPVGSFRTTHEFYYQTLKCNVNLLKMIQLGISLVNERGEVPDQCCTWQFNFKFSLQDDIYAQDSIDLLKNGGINFDYFKTYGVDMNHFAELLITSGLILNPDVHWLAFHSGYDFGYLIKTITGKDLPEREEDFNATFHLFFPSMYDIKYLLRLCDMSHTLGLDALSDILGVRRIGTAHQAGSDSLLTGHVFFKIIKERFENKTPTPAKGVLYGLSEDAASNQAPNERSSPSSAQTTGASQAGGGAGAGAAHGFPSTPAQSLVMHGGNFPN